MEIRDLKTYFFVYDGVVKALDGVSFTLQKGETLGIVGETGCGKSVTAYSILRLIQDPPGRVVSGTVLYKGMDLTRYVPYEAKYVTTGKKRVKVLRNKKANRLSDNIYDGIRGREISMIFQEPTTALNPVLTLERQVGEAILTHRRSEIVDSILSKGATDTRALLPEVSRLVDSFDESKDVDSYLIESLAALEKLVADEPNRKEICNVIVSRGVKPRTKVRQSMQIARMGNVTPAVRKLLELDKRLDELQKVERREIIAGSSTETIAAAHAAVRRAKSRLKVAKLNFMAARRYREAVRTQTNVWVEDLLRKVSIPDAHKILTSYPHELSGGMQQRVMIAMALSCNPTVLIADEPTTALDVTIQAQILDLMKQLKTSTLSSVILITHDLGVISEVCDRVSVMYAGLVAESGSVTDIFREPLHPYTKGLLAAIPRLDVPGKRLSSIPGSVPNLLKPPSGCRFHPRCPMVMDICREKVPVQIEVKKGHTVSCFLFGGGEDAN